METDLSTLEVSMTLTEIKGPPSKKSCISESIYPLQNNYWNVK